MELNRRGFFGGLLALVAAPAIVRVESLMVLPAKQEIIFPEGLVTFDPALIAGGKNALLTIGMIAREAIGLWRNSNAFLQELDAQFEESFAIEGPPIGTVLRIRYPADFVLADGSRLAGLP